MVGTASSGSHRRQPLDSRRFELGLAISGSAMALWVTLVVLIILLLDHVLLSQFSVRRTGIRRKSGGCLVCGACSRLCMGLFFSFLCVRGECSRNVWLRARGG